MWLKKIRCRKSRRALPFWVARLGRRREDEPEMREMGRTLKNVVLGFALIGHDIARKEKIRARFGVTSVTFEMPTIKEDTSYLQIWL